MGTEIDHRGRTLEQAGVDVVERLRARRTELEEAIFARLRDGLRDSPGGEDAEYVMGLRAAVAAAVGYGLRGIAEGEGWAGPIPAEVVAQARRAARLGVSLDTVLRRYVVGHTLLEDCFMEEADRSGVSGQRGAARQWLRAQASLLDRLLDAITREYRNEIERVGGSPERRHAERVQRLLAGATIDTAELSYDLDRWHLGVVASGIGAAGAVRALAAAVDRRLLSVSHGEEAVWAWLGGRSRLAVTDVERVLRGEGPAGLVLAIGEPAQGIDGWRLTHRQAQAALLVALRRSEPRRLTRYADVALLALALRDEPQAKSLIEVFLSPLDSRRDGGTVLRETLRAYFAAGRNASSAAAVLGVARHTIENRLRAVEQALGRSLQTCLPEMEIALRLDELDGLAIGQNLLPGR
jgi:PucR C-terminal helix-turn-helix domain/GGDEF-like domain